MVLGTTWKNETCSEATSLFAFFSPSPLQRSDRFRSILLFHFKFSVNPFHFGYALASLNHCPSISRPQRWNRRGMKAAAGKGPQSSWTPCHWIVTRSVKNSVVAVCAPVSHVKLSHAEASSINGIYPILYRTDGRLFNLKPQSQKQSQKHHHHGASVCR